MGERFMSHSAKSRQARVVDVETEGDLAEVDDRFGEPVTGRAVDAEEERDAAEADHGGIRSSGGSGG